MLNLRLSFVLLGVLCVVLGLAVLLVLNPANAPFFSIALLLGSASLIALQLLSISLARVSQRKLEAANANLTRLNIYRLDSASRTSLDALLKITDELPGWAARLEAERDGIKAILTTMEEGVVVVDAKKQIRVANVAARKMLDMPESDPVGIPISHIASHAGLLANIDLALTASQVCSFEFQHLVPGENRSRSIMARCAPLHDETREFSGAVAVLHDISDLRRLERMRTEFVANVSHELRTPLTSLLGYLETLEEGWEDKNQAQQFLKICRRQAENLSRIVEDLLRLSKLENPQQDVADTDIDLAEAISAALEQCLPVAKKRKIQLTTHLPSLAVTVRGDRGLIVQAIANLIENAINYNRENGWVQVRLLPISHEGEAKCQWQIVVADSGIGIPQAALKHVFERFYRVDKARSKDRGGTGLGLAIVKHIALAHGASVHVESDVGKGSTFYIRFNARAQQLADVAHA